MVNLVTNTRDNRHIQNITEIIHISYYLDFSIVILKLSSKLASITLLFHITSRNVKKKLIISDNLKYKYFS